ncbi:MAG: carbonic anhydrase [Rhabdochlamydiaceae bacterium]|nr:carbonic anhydrase [Candidatus Amphrikana amoebophyrae]
MNFKVGILCLTFILGGNQMYANDLNELTPRDGLNRLIEGNRRFMAGGSTCDLSNKARRLQTLDGQEPFAVILSCSDSRTPPEILFDQGLGDLFIVRDAGNVLGAIELESILFSIVNLHSKVLLVMGHQSCGAVTAVMNGEDHDIPAIAQKIRPAIIEAKKANGTLREAIVDNVYHSVDQLKANPILKKLVKEGKLIIRGAYYNFTTGEVEMLSPV